MVDFSSTDNIIAGNGLQITDDTEKVSKKPPQYLQIGLKTLVLSIIWAHFIWATYYFITKTDYTLNEVTCHGYGFWMIIFILINFGVIYRLILKKYLVPLVYKLLWQPIVKVLKSIKFGVYIFYGLVLLGVVIFLVLDTEDDRMRLLPLSGLVIYLLLGFILSTNKRKIPWHTVISGLILQFGLGLLMIRWETGRNIFDCLGEKVKNFLGYALEGAAFAYGDGLVKDNGGIFAFSALSTIYFLGFVINILYYYGIMQEVVANMGRFLEWAMDTSICESVNSAANIFLGMSEAPLLLKPYLTALTDSEIHSVMTSGFATVSGTVLAAYIKFGADPATLITASVMSAPAALCYSKLMYPETEEVEMTRDKVRTVKIEYESVLDAASKGAYDASQIVIGIISSVIAFIAFISFINGVLSWLGILVGFVDESEQWTIDLIVGKILIPVTYTMGVEWADCEKVGQLIGIKTMVNEFVAFQKLGQMTLSPRSRMIATYSICGFANPGSIGIMLSALGILMPTKKAVLIRLVFRAFIGGCVACFMTACIAALLIS